jgi:hypothetical protein
MARSITFALLALLGFVSTNGVAAARKLLGRRDRERERKEKEGEKRKRRRHASRGDGNRRWVFLAPRLLALFWSSACSSFPNGSAAKSS